MQLDIYQKKVVEANEDKILCLAGAGSGKAILNSTIIPTPKGPRKVSDIRVGDFLFDKYGKPTKVLGVFPQGKLDVYEITFGDGRKALCSEDHLWWVSPNRGLGKFREMTVKELLSKKLLNSNNGANYYIPCAKPLQYQEKKYSIHPYVVGAFLGDGCCVNHSRLVLSSENEELPKICAELFDEEVIPELWYNNKYKYQFRKKDNSYFLTKEFFCNYKNELIQYSQNKRIPTEYKYGSIEQRLELIKGLFDTDGSIQKDNGAVRFTSTSLGLIKDVQEVLSSLGYVSHLFEEKRKELYKDKCYYILVNIPHSEKYKLFKLPRKLNVALNYKDKKQNKRFNVTSIRSIQKLNYQEEMTCFLVDNEEHLFLMNDCIVTHNTTVLTERVRNLINKKNQDPSKVVCICFTNMAADEMKKRLENVREGMFIGTLHSYANQLCLDNGIDTSHYIEMNEFDKILEKALVLPRSKFPIISHLLVDEAQDLGSLDYQFLEKCNASNRFFVADDRQAIYQFRGCSDKYIKNMASDDEYKKYYLHYNYRCAPNIQNFANSLLYSYEALSPCPDSYKKRNGLLERNMVLGDALSELQWSKNWGSWFILTRTNEELAQIQELLNNEDIPNVTFKKGDLDNVELEEIMESNKVKVLTIHSAKGLQNKNVIVTGVRMYNYDERRIGYVAATRAENALYWCTSFRKYQKGKRRKSTTLSGQIFDKTKVKTIEF